MPKSRIRDRKAPHPVEMSKKAAVPRCPIHGSKLSVVYGVCRACKDDEDRRIAEEIEILRSKQGKHSAPAELSILVVDTGRVLRFRLPPVRRRRR